MPLHRLTSIRVGVPDVDAARAFYRDFGLTETAPARFGTLHGGDQLELVAAPRRRLIALGVGVDDADDLRRISAQLTTLDAVAKLDGDSLRVTEPATNLSVEIRVAPRLVQPSEPPLPQNGPGRTVRLDARSAAISTKEGVRPRKLGHVVMASTDAIRTRRFFTDGIGFQLSDEIGPMQIAFLRCSTDHHNLLIQPGPVDFLHHTAWEVGDVDEIGRGAAHLLEGAPERHVWGLGRHGIGSNFFWYLRDPAGNFVEYYSDLDVIEDDDAWRARSAGGAQGLAAWGPPVPGSFLAPEDIRALAASRS